ncbi:MAG TPA: hypothetical protein VK933_16920, partial [Longimicrobiales bacterium]|nr:hypothetical protein [Longimicrobiales bacterium]
MRSWLIVLAGILTACGSDGAPQGAAVTDTLRAGNAPLADASAGAADEAAADDGATDGSSTAARATRADGGPRTDLPPNELGRFPVVEYHLIGAEEARWTRTPENFRRDLELLYSRGYRPVSLRDVAAKKIDLPAGTSPVVFTFDDASPGQFSYIEENGELRIDPRSAVGIWLDFAKEHDGWENKAVFCMLSGAEAGRAFFGNKDIAGQKTEWRQRRVKFLAEQGFELCNHTLWHAT